MDAFSPPLERHLDNLAKTNPRRITADGSDFIAEFPMAYALTNRKGTNSGTLQMTLRLKSQAQTWEIIAIQKKVIQVK